MRRRQSQNGARRSANVDALARIGGGVSTARPSAAATIGQCLNAQRRDGIARARPAPAPGAAGSPAAPTTSGDGRAMTAATAATSTPCEPCTFQVSTRTRDRRPRRQQWQTAGRRSRTVGPMPPPPCPPFLHPFAKPHDAVVHRHRARRRRPRLGSRRHTSTSTPWPACGTAPPATAGPRSPTPSPPSSTSDRRVLVLRAVHQRPRRRAGRAARRTSPRSPMPGCSSAAPAPRPSTRR